MAGRRRFKVELEFELSDEDLLRRAFSELPQIRVDEDDPLSGILLNVLYDMDVLAMQRGKIQGFLDVGLELMDEHVEEVRQWTSHSCGS